MIDIKFTASDDPEHNGDIAISNTGDISFTEPTEQHQRDILLAGQGHYKQAPSLGVDSGRYLMEPEIDDYLRNVRKQFTRDGMKVKSIDYKYGELIIEADYE